MGFADIIPALTFAGASGPDWLGAAFTTVQQSDKEALMVQQKERSTW